MPFFIKNSIFDKPIIKNGHIKKVAFLTLILTQGVFYFQTKEGIKTEQLLNLPAVLVEKTFTEVGKVKEIKIIIMAVKNLSANTTKNVIRIEG